MVIDQMWLTLIVSTVLPALVALATRWNAPSHVKGLLLALLSAVTAVVTQLQADGGAFDWQASVSLLVVSFVTATASHYGLLKPLKVTGSKGVIARAVPGGLGKKSAYDKAA